MIVPPENQHVFGAPIISPDGRRLAFVATTRKARRKLGSRPIDAMAPQPLPGTEGATYPFWSPDSRFIAFFASGQLKKIDVAGGSPQTICEATNGREARGASPASSSSARGFLRRSFKCRRREDLRRR